MSFLVKGMDMPKQAGAYHARIKVYEEGYPTISVTEDNITTTYDMIPVPTPHGRLIDADDLDSITVVSYPSTGDLFVAGRLKKIIAPTIIEMEE